jgi:hypothetical protein
VVHDFLHPFESTFPETGFILKAVGFLKFRDRVSGEERSHLRFRNGVGRAGHLLRIVFEGDQKHLRAGLEQRTEQPRVCRPAIFRHGDERGPIVNEFETSGVVQRQIEKIAHEIRDVLATHHGEWRALGESDFDPMLRREGPGRDLG